MIQRNVRIVAHRVAVGNRPRGRRHVLGDTAHAATEGNEICHSHSQHKNFIHTFQRFSPIDIRFTHLTFFEDPYQGKKATHS